jgi:ribosomal-protein-alanine N-acetyltransferase
MERRSLDYVRDIDDLTEMQALSFEINFPDERFIPRFFQDSLRQLGRDDRVYVYEEDHVIVGWLWLDLGRGESAVHVRHIQVREGRWGSGIGKRLLEDAISLCAAMERPTLTLNVTKANSRAMSLYDHLGFRAVEDHGDRQYMTLQVVGGKGKDKVSARRD